MNKNIRLAKKHGANILPFKKLPIEARYALIWYMAIDGEAWEIAEEIYQAWKKGLPKNNGSQKYWNKVDSLGKKAIKTRNCMQFYLEKYGEVKFGYAKISTKDMIKRLLETENMRDGFDYGEWKTFEDWHNWYGKNMDMPNHSSRNKWPCILAEDNFDLLQDGWHRFNRYIQMGCRTIPCVFWN